VNIGRHCRIRRAIIDRDVQSRKAQSLALTEEDARNYVVTETGITLVTRDYSLFENPVAVIISPAISWLSSRHFNIGPTIAASFTG